MAIDSKAKRGSVLSSGWEEFGLHFPSAGGINSDAERAAVAYNYYGITLDPPVTVTYNPKLDRRRRSFAALEA